MTCELPWWDCTTRGHPSTQNTSSMRVFNYSTRNAKTNLRAKSRATVSEQKTLTNKDAIPLFILCLCSHFEASAYVTYCWPSSNPLLDWWLHFSSSQPFFSSRQCGMKVDLQGLETCSRYRSIKTSSRLQIRFVFLIQHAAMRLRNIPRIQAQTSSRTPDSYRPDGSICVKKTQCRSAKDMFQVQRGNIIDASHKFTSSLNNIRSAVEVTWKMLSITHLHLLLHQKRLRQLQVVHTHKSHLLWERWTVLNFCRYPHMSIFSNSFWLIAGSVTIIFTFFHIIQRIIMGKCATWFFLTNTDNDLLLLADTDEFTILYLKK